MSSGALALYIEECTRVSETVMDIFKPAVEEAWKALQKEIAPMGK